MTTSFAPHEFAVRCPQCRRRALARMVPRGTQGTYLEVYVHFAAARMSCSECGYARDVPPEAGEDYELWYATEFDGHRVWARNAEDLDRLIAWIAGGARKRRGSTDHAYPRWLRTRKHRPELLRRLQRLRDEGPGP